MYQTIPYSVFDSCDRSCSVCLLCLNYVVFCFLVFGCHYQCSRFLGNSYLRNDLLCVECDVKPYPLTHSP